MAYTPIANGDREAMILRYLPLVELLARRLRQRCPKAELADLISSGTVGLIQAIDRFDPARELKFKTFAQHRIHGAMLDYLRQIDPLSRQIREFQQRRDAMIADREIRGEGSTHETIAQALGMTPERYIRLSQVVTASHTLYIEDLPGLSLRV